MTWKVLFHKVKGEFSTKPLLLLAWHITTRFTLGGGPDTNQFLYHQTKAYEQYHEKQAKYCLSKRLNNHSRGVSALGLSICTSKQQVLDFS